MEPLGAAAAVQGYVKTLLDDAVAQGLIRA
jgi:hypothetical protein